MNIRDCEHASGVVANWLGMYANQHGKKALIVGLTTDIPSMLTALLCSKIGEYTTRSIMDVVPKTICVHMTSDSKSPKAKRLAKFVGDHNIGRLVLVPTIDSTIMYEGSDLYPGGYPLDKEPEESERVIPIPGSTIDQQESYEKSLMAMVLAHFADVHDGLVVGTITATRGVLQRRYRKHGDGSADVFPLLDLHDSEVRQLAQHWNIEPVSSIFPPAVEPEDGVEWAHRENDRYQIVTSADAQPQQHRLWYKYTAPQKQLISELYAREKKTKHKTLLNKPYCKLRHIEGLFAQ